MARPVRLVTDERQDAGWADLSAAAELESLPERFLYCREVGHHRRPFSTGRHKDGGFERMPCCSRIRRVQVVNSPKMVLSNHCIHPGGCLGYAGATNRRQAACEGGQE